MTVRELINELLDCIDMDVDARLYTEEPHLNVELGTHIRAYQFNIDKVVHHIPYTEIVFTDRRKKKNADSN